MGTVGSPNLQLATDKRNIIIEKGLRRQRSEFRRRLECSPWRRKAARVSAVTRAAAVEMAGTATAAEVLTAAVVGTKTTTAEILTAKVVVQRTATTATVLTAAVVIAATTAEVLQQQQ